MAHTLRNLGLHVFTKHNASTNDIRLFLEQKIPVIVNYQDSTMTEGHYGVIIGFENGKLVLNDPYEAKPVIIDPTLFAKRWHGYHKTQFTRWLLVASDKPLRQT